MKSPNLFGGLLLICLGAIFLLNNFGIIGWDIWFTLISFWPLFLIALGLKIMFRNNLFIQFAAVLLILLVPLGYYLGFGPQGVFPDWERGVGHYRTHNWSMEREEISQAKLKLNYGAGRLMVGSGSKLADLRAGTRAGQPDIRVKHQGEAAEIVIDQAPIGFPFQIMPRRGGWNQDWVLSLSQEVVWDLDFRTGAVKAEFDLKDLKFSRLSLDTGAGDIRIVLGDMGNTAQVDVDSGAGNVTIVIPAEVGVIAEIHSGPGNKNLRGRDWQQEDRTYTSANYHEAASKIILELNHGVGNVNILTD